MARIAEDAGEQDDRCVSPAVGIYTKSKFKGLALEDFAKRLRMEIVH